MHVFKFGLWLYYVATLDVLNFSDWNNQMCNTCIMSLLKQQHNPVNVANT